MDDKHPDLLPELHRDVVLEGPGDFARDLVGVFGFFAAGFASINVRTTLSFGWGGITDFLRGAIARGAFAG